MKKRLLSIILVLCMVLTLLPTVVLASEPTQAQWGLAGDGGSAPSSWTQGTLAEAITYANSLSTDTAYIQLWEDIDKDNHGTWPLEISTGKTTILDLNGKSINRGLTEAIEYGNVINVHGTLTLKDSSTNIVANQGVITGGKSNSSDYPGGEGGGGVLIGKNASFTLQGGKITGNISTNADIGGGGVYVSTSGTFNMQGGSIEGNEAKNWGGGVYADGVVNMTGGTITENYSVKGGGVYFSATFSVGGTAVIKGNFLTETRAVERNVVVFRDKPIEVVSPLTTGAKIGVTADTPPATGSPKNITGSNSEDYSSYFFSDNADYTIQNSGSGNEQVVKLIVNPAMAITAFSFNDLSPNVTGTVSEDAKTIALTVPYGTDVTALVPTIAHTGASISPNTGVPTDFTSPVTYTVTAADTTIQVYTVTVTVAANSAKAITAFSFNDLSPNVTGTVNEDAKTIALTVPYGTDVTALVPTITHTGASISPDTGEAHDFTNPVTYTVTAADDSIQQYTVTVTVAANSAKAITAFSFNDLSPNVTGTVNEDAKTIALTVPYGTTVTALVPTITHTGASISPNTGVPTDFTSPVTYTVTAADTTTQVYTVTVTVAANSPQGQAPTATVQAITGTLQVGATLTGHYTYSDADGDSEGTSTYKWYRSDNASGLNKTAIGGATSITYVLQSADTGKYISFEVTPVAATGTAQGTAVESALAGAVVTPPSPSDNGGSNTSPAPVTRIDNGGSTTGSNLDQLISGEKTLTVDGDKGAKLVFGTDALKGIDSQTSGDIKVEMKDVSPAHQESLPGKLVFSLTVSSGSNTVSNFGGSVTISLPYELKEGETADKVTVWHLADDGTMTEIPCTYDPVTMLATFTVTHFSLYVVGVAGTEPWVNPFTDVSKSDWFYGAVEFTNQNGLFAGTGAANFSPNSPMTRAMLWTVLSRLDGQSFSGSGEFDAARIWAMGAGITDGTNPDGNITREQMVAILWRYAGSPKAGGDLSKFSDAGSVASYAADAMAWAVKNDIIVGANGALMPKDNANRAQVAAIMQRFIEGMAK